MKKTVVYALALCVLFGFGVNFADAKIGKKAKKTEETVSQTVELQEGANLTDKEFKMPTDEEIKSVLSQFNFDEKQKEYLFKEIKKKFEETEAQNLQKNPL